MHLADCNMFQYLQASPDALSAYAQWVQKDSSKDPLPYNEHLYTEVYLKSRQSTQLLVFKTKITTTSRNNSINKVKNLGYD